MIFFVQLRAYWIITEDTTKFMRTRKERFGEMIDYSFWFFHGIQLFGR